MSGAEGRKVVLPETSPDQPMAPPLTQPANDHSVLIAHSSPREEPCMETVTVTPTSATALELLTEAGINLTEDSDDEIRTIMIPSESELRGTADDGQSKHVHQETRIAVLETALARSLISRKELRRHWATLK